MLAVRSTIATELDVEGAGSTCNHSDGWSFSAVWLTSIHLRVNSGGGLVLAMANVSASKASVNKVLKTAEVCVNVSGSCAFW